MSLNPFPQSFKAGLAAAIEGATAGGRRDAGHAFLANGIGASPIIKLYKSGALVGTGSLSVPLTANTTLHQLLVGTSTITITAAIAPTDALTFEILKNDGTVGLRGSFPTDAVLSAAVDPGTGSLVYTIDDLVAEMTGVNAANPGAVINNPNWGARLFHGYVFDGYPGGGNVLYPWYEVHPPHPSVTPWTVSAPNTQVEITNLRVLRRDGAVWNQVLQRNTSSGWWANHFYDKADYGQPTRDSNETPIVNGVAQPANQMGFLGDKWIWHGFADSGVASTGLTSVIYAACFDARLALINPAGTDDRANVKLLAHVAADWYGASGIISEAFHARVKYLTNDWQRFGVVNITTSKSGSNFPGALTEAELRANPPSAILTA